MIIETAKNLDLEEIRKGFEMFDVDQTGKISPSELLETFDAMNLKAKNPFIYNLISSLSEEQDEVSIDDLISYIDQKLSDNQSSEGINLIFDSLCEPNDDTLTLSTLPHIARESEDIISEKELRYLIERAQMGGEEINFEEFLQIVKENSENDSQNGKEGGLKLSSGGKINQPQVYRKKASNSNKISQDNNIINNKKDIRNENIMKNSEDKINNLYDTEDIRERKTKKNPRIKDKNNSNLNDNLINNADNVFNKDDNIKIKDKEINIEKEIENEEKKENGNILQSPKKESGDEEENGMESVNQSINQSINRYLEKKIENDSIKNKKMKKDDENINLNINGKIINNNKEPEIKINQEKENKIKNNNSNNYQTPNKENIN